MGDENCELGSDGAVGEWMMNWGEAEDSEVSRSRLMSANINEYGLVVKMLVNNDGKILYLIDESSLQHKKPHAGE